MQDIPSKDKLKIVLEEHRYIQRYNTWYHDEDTRRASYLERWAKFYGYSILKGEEDDSEYKIALRIWRNKCRKNRNYRTLNTIIKEMKDYNYKVVDGVVYNIKGVTIPSLYLEQLYEEKGYKVKIIEKNGRIESEDERRKRELDELWKKCKSSTDRVIHYNLHTAPWTERDEALYQYYRMKYCTDDYKSHQTNKRNSYGRNMEEHT